MHTPDFSEAAALASKLGFHTDFAEYRQLLLQAALRDAIPGIRAADGRSRG